jgi:hypothetical protein
MWTNVNGRTPSHMEEHEHMEHGDQKQQNKYGSKDMRTDTLTTMQ